MTTKLRLYNGALALIGERKLSTLTDTTEGRRVLDDVYDEVRLLALEAGFWKFALRTSKLSYTDSVVVDFGYAHAFEKPEDLLRVHKLCEDEMLQVPLLDFSEESSFWFSHNTELYISYVSTHASYGLDLSKWGPAFTNYVQHLLAERVVHRISPPSDVGKLGNNNLERKLKTALSEAHAKDAMQGPPMFHPSGTWTSARGGYGRRRDRNRGRLIG